MDARDFYSKSIPELKYLRLHNLQNELIQASDIAELKSPITNLKCEISNYFLLLVSDRLSYFYVGYMN